MSILLPPPSIDPTSPNDPTGNESAIDRAIPLDGPAPIATEHAARLRVMVRGAQEAYDRAEAEYLDIMATLSTPGQRVKVGYQRAARAGALDMAVRICKAFGVDVDVRTPRF